MNIPELIKFREKFPQYADMDDSTLATKLAEKYPSAYSDLPAKIETGTIQDPRTGAIEDLQSKIAQRPDIYGQAVQSAQQLPQATLQSAGKGSPGLPLANTLLQSLGGIAQRGEAAIANPFLAMSEGSLGTYPQRALQGIKQGITGERLGELGDVARRAGLPEPVSATLGLIGTGILGGALARGAGLTQKANNLTKIQTAYGHDIGKNVIRHSTELPMPLVERGMVRGWKRILTKSNAQDLKLPTRISSYVMDSLDDITQREYDEFGKAISRVKNVNVKAIDLSQTVDDMLKKFGYIDETFNPTLKQRGPIANKILDFLGNARKNKIKPDESIPLEVIRTFKNILKKSVPEKNWIGKTRSLRGEQRLAKELSNAIDDLISFSLSGTDDFAFNNAKRRYSEFKNFEKAIVNTFAEVVGQEVTPTGDRIVGLGSMPPTKMLEEIDKLHNIDSFLNSKGYSSITDRLLDWVTTQEMMVVPKGGVFKRFTESPIKYGMRQFLGSGVPTAMGNVGKVARPVVNPLDELLRKNIIPPAIMREFTGRNEIKY